MTIDLYLTRMSTQCSAIRMLAAALDIELNLIYVNMADKEHLKPEFLAINPQHTVPTLNDNGFALWETRAILTYLVEQYGSADQQLFPVGDAQKRATINQRLYFDMGTLYQRLVAAYFASATEGTEAKTKLSDALAFLEGFLSGSGDQFVAGAELTVADFVLFTTISLIELVQHDLSGYPQLGAWYKRLQQTLPGKEINVTALEGVRAYIEAKKANK